MAAAVLRVLRDRAFAERLRAAALIDVQQYTWLRVRQRWTDVYASVVPRACVEARSA